MKTRFGLIGLIGLFGLSAVTLARGETNTNSTLVRFSLLTLTGSAQNRNIILTPTDSPLRQGRDIVWSPPIVAQPTNGVATVSMVPDEYYLRVAGLPGTLRLNVHASTNVLEAVNLITNLVTYRYTNPAPIEVTATNAIALLNGSGTNTTLVNPTSTGGNIATTGYVAQAIANSVPAGVVAQGTNLQLFANDASIESGASEFGVYATNDIRIYSLLSTTARIHLEAQGGVNINKGGLNVSGPAYFTNGTFHLGTNSMEMVNSAAGTAFSEGGSNVLNLASNAVTVNAALTAKSISVPGTNLTVTGGMSVGGNVSVTGAVTAAQFSGPLSGTASNATTWNGLHTNILSGLGGGGIAFTNDVDAQNHGLTNLSRMQVGGAVAVAGYSNTLSGTTIASNLTATGSFSGDGTQLSNVVSVVHVDEASIPYGSDFGIMAWDSDFLYVSSMKQVQVGNISCDYISLTNIYGSAPGLSNLNASAASIGTLPDARLSTNVALMNAASNLFTGTIRAKSFRCLTNGWAPNTPLGLETNAVFTSSTATLGITGVANLPASDESSGKITLKASGGDITFTNPTSIRLSDHLASRVVTNGNTAVLMITVTAGFSTNGFWVQ